MAMYNKIPERVTEGCISKTLITILGDDLVNDGHSSFLWLNEKWVNVKKNYELWKKEITNLLFNYFTILLTTQSLESEQREKVLKILLFLEKQNNVNHISGFVDIHIWGQNKDIEWDKGNPYEFYFDNCGFNMKTKKKLPIDKYKYLTFSAGYKYEEPTQKQIDTLQEIFIKIMPNDEKRKCLLSVLRNGCIAKQSSKFVIFSGGGSNGKGLFMEYCEKMLGDYFTRIGNEFILNPIKIGANTEMCGFDNKRFVVFSETEATDKMYAGTLKQITDQPYITTRSLYETKLRSIKMVCQNVLECNAKPRVSGRTDYSIERRLVDLRFSQTFVDEEKYDGSENQHIKNPLYKDPTFVETHLSAFFRILLNLDVDGVYMPEEVRNDSKDYLHTSDELITFIDDNYEKVEDDTQYVKIKDMWAYFKNTELWGTLTKDEKRNTWSYKQFTERLKATTKYRKDYRERYQKNGLNVKNILVNYRQMDGF